MRHLVYIFLVLGFYRLSCAQEAEGPADVDSASVSLSGYVTSSYHMGSGSGSYPYALSTSRRNSFTLDVAALSLRQPLDEWLFDSGFRLDLWLGPDASLLGTGNDDTIHIRQAFIDLRIPLLDPRVTGTARSLDLRAGTFDSPLGFESLDRDSSNPHYTRSWGFTIEPTLHTGVLAMYPAVDALENGESDFLFSLGIANSIDPQINGAPSNSDRKSLLSGITWLLPHSAGPLSGTALSVGYINGRTQTNSSPVQNLYLAAGLPLPSPKWDLALTYDSRIEYGEGNDDSVWGTYLSYHPNDNSTLSLRGEVFQEGSKLFSSESLSEQSDGYGLTATFDYRFSENLLSRSEWRWDHTESRVNERHNSQSWHLSLIYEF
tara:strand:+ start:1518 stop:2645 length:1128 start_codon:yes stop_codon:yes gene_type:complete